MEIPVSRIISCGSSRGSPGKIGGSTVLRTEEVQNGVLFPQSECGGPGGIRREFAANPPHEAHDGGQLVYPAIRRYIRIPFFGVAFYSRRSPSRTMVVSMRPTVIGRVSAVLVVCLLVSSLFSIFAPRATASALTPHSAISINGNAGFTA